PPASGWPCRKAYCPARDAAPRPETGRGVPRPTTAGSMTACSRPTWPRRSALPCPGGPVGSGDRAASGDPEGNEPGNPFPRPDKVDALTRGTDERAPPRGMSRGFTPSPRIGQAQPLPVPESVLDGWHKTSCAAVATRLSRTL